MIKRIKYHRFAELLRCVRFIAENTWLIFLLSLTTKLYDERNSWQWNALALLTSGRVKNRIVERIVDQYPDHINESIKSDIITNYLLTRASNISQILSVLLSLFAAWSVHPGASDGHLLYLGLLWWAFGWYLIFYVAARGIIVGTFYVTFCRHLVDAEDLLYRHDPAKSVIVEDLASVGRTLVPFWFGIAVSILLVIPFIMEPMKDVSVFQLIFQLRLKEALKGLPHIENRIYLDLIIPVTIFGALIPGTVSFLLSEAWIGKAVDNVRLPNMSELESRLAV